MFATCTWDEIKGPEWSGHNHPEKNPLESILENEFIFPPTVFAVAVAVFWLAWRENELDNEQTIKEITDLYKWVNKVTEIKLQTEVFSQTFLMIFCKLSINFRIDLL